MITTRNFSTGCDALLSTFDRSNAAEEDHHQSHQSKTSSRLLARFPSFAPRCVTAWAVVAVVRLATCARIVVAVQQSFQFTVVALLPEMLSPSLSDDFGQLRLRNPVGLVEVLAPEYRFRQYSSESSLGASDAAMVNADLSTGWKQLSSLFSCPGPAAR